MGRDIHIVAEYDRRGTPPFIDPDALAVDVNVPRDHALFQALAGAGGSDFLSVIARLGKEQFRSQAAEARVAIDAFCSKPPLFAPRGVPARRSRAVVERLFIRVGTAPEHWSGVMYATRDEAEAWVAKGVSTYTSDARDWVFDPDAHTISYLSLAEVDAALRHAQLDVVRTPAEFQGLIQMMQVVEAACGTGRTRLVFWFDN